MTELFQNFFSDFIIFIAESRILGAIIILLLFSLLAKLVDLFIHRIINFVSKKSKIEIDDTFIGIIHRPVWISILLIGGLSAVKWVHFYSRFTFTLTAMLKSLLIIVIGLTLNKLMKSICQRWCSIRRQWVEIIHFSENIGRVLLLIIGVGLLLTFWKINVTPLLASAGIAGIAIALAAKDTIANFFGGINLFMDKPFSRGDYIVLETGERGEVVDIGVRSTRIRTRDDEQISVPNSIVANTKIINESVPEPRFRVRIRLNVAYDSDLDKVEETLLDVARSNQSIAREPEPRVRFRSFGDSFLDFELLCWAKTPADRGRVIHELNRSIFSEFNKRDIKIPFPRQDIHIHSLPPNTTGKPRDL